jgi:hypothetical protein
MEVWTERKRAWVAVSYACCRKLRQVELRGLYETPGVLER